MYRPTQNSMIIKITSIIDVFSKFLFLVPVKKKSCPVVTTAFLLIFDDDDRKKIQGDPYGQDKGKEFLNKHFQDMLRDEGI